MATVDRNGEITSIGVGHAVVTATYTHGDRNVRIAVQVDVPELVLTASSRSLTFDEQRIATASTPEQLTLTNTSHGPIKVVAITTAGEDFVEADNCPTLERLPVGASCTILVSFKPTEAGQRRGTLKIHKSVTGSPDVISLNGTGVRR